ncbi:hypothetical protein Tco_0908525 [Tanacetum coccineum]|uniref:Uncharacterized protein n=1 Tax=Tanacetum coccineum TaxID=301880 RepID=A0ABQ5CMK6_9ASTR
MILNLVLNGLLVWPTVDEENGTTRTKKYKELSVAEKLQADCDLKATNIVLQVLPPDVYAIVNLMQGTKLSLQEKECKLYDEFDKFSFVKGETLLLPEWSKFVTSVKLDRDLHTTNFDQLYSYLEQHEAHANETRLLHERYWYEIDIQEQDKNKATNDKTKHGMEKTKSNQSQRSGYHQKDRNPSQNDKTEHGMEKTVQNQGQSPKMPKSESILKNQQSNRSRN